jgi:hypothetical protein
LRAADERVVQLLRAAGFSPAIRNLSFDLSLANTWLDPFSLSSIMLLAVHNGGGGRQPQQSQLPHPSWAAVLVEYQNDLACCVLKRVSSLY